MQKRLVPFERYNLERQATVRRPFLDVSCPLAPSSQELVDGEQLHLALRVEEHCTSLDRHQPLVDQGDVCCLHDDPAGSTRAAP